MVKYILVQWPESQMLMEHERFNECLFIDDIEGHIDVGSSAYMCPEDLYNELFVNKYSIDSPKWENNLIMCPSQCYCNFEGDGKEYCIYLRWRWDDPWTAQLVPCNDDWEMDYRADWEYLNVQDYTHDDYLKLQEECIKVINKMFDNITWYEEEEE